ncbi:dTDP-4-dehydrorhamnose reductase [Maritimibacter sp. DP07]|uniref:dTDP-4-dehydrorhamnose reductase n=1 Tax=Maritimibacter harenae TaxID=2606218 RepID=A0A845M488_9RHOB|nr:dTDP-4-dehydrorhamnose reductase [Maritimibacter harenae]MZR13819.1 dTDP-4-dehydrorhamnose reductase [Maritimibacter harenae]
MRLLVFGQTGQVATELARRAPEAVFLGREQADLANPVSCASAIRTHIPDAVINAAAYTAVDRAEGEEQLATRVNGYAPAEMAHACAALDIPMIHISTDYVFDGCGSTPWHLDGIPTPKNAYGRSKLVGEQAIAKARGPHAILRTAWVFSAHGNNFVRSMLRLSQTHEVLRIVDDQVGGPTPAADIAAACLSMAAQLKSDHDKTGTYHYTGAPDISWKGFAEEILTMAGRDATVTGIPTTKYPTPAQRPLNSRLDCTTTEMVFGLPRPDWRSGLVDVLTELGEISA